MEQKTGSTTGWRHDMLGSFPKELRPDAILSAGRRENSVEVRVQGLVAPSGAHCQGEAASSTVSIVMEMFRGPPLGAPSS